MINTIKFITGSVLSIPIYENWIKVKTRDLEENHLVISVNNGVPVDIDTLMSEIDVGFIIFASNNVDFASVDQDLEHIYNAMEFDLYRRTMKIGIADLIKLHDLDNWRYANGIPVELQLHVKVLEDDDGHTGLSIRADNDVATALMKQIKSVSSDGYSISSSKNVPVEHGIDARANLGIVQSATNHMPIEDVDTTLTTVNGSIIGMNGNIEDNGVSGNVSMSHTYNSIMHFINNAEFANAINMDNIEHGIIEINADDDVIASISAALHDMESGLEMSSDEFDVSVGASIMTNGDGTSYLVLHAPEDVEITQEYHGKVNLLRTPYQTSDMMDESIIFNSGQIVTASNYTTIVTPLVPVTAGMYGLKVVHDDRYEALGNIHTGNNYNNGFGFFAADGETVVSRPSLAQPLGNNIYLIEVPSSASYIRFCVTKFNASLLQQTIDYFNQWVFLPDADSSITDDFFKLYWQ